MNKSFGLATKAPMRSLTCDHVDECPELTGASDKLPTFCVWADCLMAYSHPGDMIPLCGYEKYFKTRPKFIGGK